MRTTSDPKNSLRSYLLGTLQGQVQLSTYVIILIGFGVASTGSLRLANKDLQHHHHMQVERQSSNLKKCIYEGQNRTVKNRAQIEQCLSTFSGWGMLSWAINSDETVILPNPSFAKIDQNLIAASRKGICNDSTTHNEAKTTNESCTLDIKVRLKKQQTTMHSSHMMHHKRAVNPDSIFSITATRSPNGNLRLFSAEDITLHAGVDSSLLITLLSLWTGTLAVSVVVVGSVVRKIVPPLNDLVLQADKFNAEDLSSTPTFSTKQTLPYEIQKLLNSYTNLIRRLSFSWQQQQQFVSAVSHELRTPLSICSGYTNRLLRKRDQLSSSQIKSIEVIDEEVKRIIQLVADLLELSRADFGTLKINRSITGAADFINSCTENIASRISNPIITDIHPEAQNAVIYVDQDKLKQVLTNLTENASKYSSNDATIKVEIGLASSNYCAINVIDSGIGIPAGDLPFIFDRFYRASNTGSIIGSGMGLSVVKMMIESMGGQIRVESTLSVGTKISLLVPIADQQLQE